MKGRIIAVAATAIYLTSAPAHAQAVAQFDEETTARLQLLQPFIDEASDRFGVPDAWVRAVIAAESGGRTTVKGEPITSRAGAIGPMQVMPRTYDELRLRYGLGPDPAEPEQNILAGTAYLKELHERFGRAGMFAAYNAGPERYQAYLNGMPLPDETRAYLATLGNVLSDTAAEAIVTSGKDLFFPLSGQNPGNLAGQSAPNSNALFIPLASPAPTPSAEKKGRERRRERSSRFFQRMPSQVKRLSGMRGPKNAVANPRAPLRGCGLRPCP
ncbi:MAG: lytic transglycosylase domain-containing protein [Dongiaceae bacterium]